MSYRLSKIDELSRRDHYHLAEGDECWYFGEYTAQKGWSFSDTNNLINNFKKDMELKGTNQWPHKMRAIKEIGSLIASTLSPSNLDGLIITPVPPSKITTDPAYDPRILQALHEASKKLGGNLPVSQCVTQKQNSDPDHLSGKTRLYPEERAATYNFHPELIPEGTRTVWIVDDVITTGSHYKGIELILKQAIPNLHVRGLFVARTVHENPFENEEIDLSEFFV